MAEPTEKPLKFVAGLIYGEPGEDSFSTEELLKKEFDCLDGLGKWKHVCALAGLALYEAQLFEADLFNIILYHARVMGTVATEDEYDALEADLTGKTLGVLLGKVRKLINITEDAVEVVSDALRLRNQLCHGFFFKRANDLLTHAGMRRISAELIETKRVLENAQIVSQVTQKMLLKLAGVDEDDILAEAAQDKRAARLLEGESEA